ncbi:UNVERIFIED_CONTAM: putative mitochondrial protein [Sesamum calycinum]|uniref:Mitochondrial protein n=1 Tax=Sesamum calycinum TaxID=2727403 RepID=A0AAW2KXI6_9LAMI
MIKKLLKEFDDAKLDELPQKLPPKRAVDHEIELVLGTKPPAMTLYGISFHTFRPEERSSNLQHTDEPGSGETPRARVNVKVLKCSFAQETISFLFHFFFKEKWIRMVPKKVQAIKECQLPNDLHELRSFLDLENYYRRFVMGYSKIAWPMMDLLKKTETWNWTP